MKFSVLFIFILLISSSIWASDPPCSEFEFFIKAHEVQAYTKKNGTNVASTDRKEHCREIFLGTKKWAAGFSDKSLEYWPYKEQFKSWTKNEKEIILKIISTWPDLFQNWQGATLHRASKSSFKDNPAASLPKSNAIIIYDNFFTYQNRSAVLTHELAYIYILTLNPDRLDKILRISGWERSATNKPKWTGKKPLKEDSPESPSEDLANHVEDFLHYPSALKKQRPEIFNKLQELLGTDFHLKEQK